MLSPAAAFRITNSLTCHWEGLQAAFSEDVFCCTCLLLLNNPGECPCVHTPAEAQHTYTSLAWITEFALSTSALNCHRDKEKQIQDVVCTGNIRYKVNATVACTLWGFGWDVEHSHIFLHSERHGRIATTIFLSRPRRAQCNIFHILTSADSDLWGGKSRPLLFKLSNIFLAELINISRQQLQANQCLGSQSRKSRVHSTVNITNLPLLTAE